VRGRQLAAWASRRPGRGGRGVRNNGAMKIVRVKPKELGDKTAVLLDPPRISLDVSQGWRSCSGVWRYSGLKVVLQCEKPSALQGLYYACKGTVCHLTAIDMKLSIAVSWGLFTHTCTPATFQAACWTVCVICLPLCLFRSTICKHYTGCTGTGSMRTIYEYVKRFRGLFSILDSRRTRKKCVRTICI
jgi:hypothetical protein